MNPFLKYLSLCAAFIALSLPVWGRQSIEEFLQPATENNKGESAPVDSLGRQTPNGTLLAFFRLFRQQTTARPLSISSSVPRGATPREKSLQPN